MENDRRIAVLIDADNVSEKYVKFIFDEISNHGTPTYKRIYGDWTRPQFASWKSVLLNYSIIPIQQYSYTTGKNATDAALIIDAMDILYSENIDGFCIVSSDSDFTRLAARLRESGMYVLGMGEKKTPTAFISACEMFKYLEVLANPPAPSHESGEDCAHDGASKSGMADKEKLVETVRLIVEENSDEDGWVYMGAVGKMLSKRFPDFDTRNYGFSKLTPLISSLKHFEIQSRRTNNPNVVFKYIRNKDNKEARGDGREACKEGKSSAKDTARESSRSSVKDTAARENGGHDSTKDVQPVQEIVSAVVDSLPDGTPAIEAAEASAAVAKPRGRRRGSRGGQKKTAAKEQPNANKEPQ